MKTKTWATIYHNPRCRKSREGLEVLKSHVSDIEVVEYLKKPLSSRDLQRLSAKLELPFQLMVRKQEDYYKQHLKGRELSEEEWIEVLLAQPQLLIRPIIETADKATIGYPPENILSIL